jgi:hypothetical protein
MSPKLFQSFPSFRRSSTPAGRLGSPSRGRRVVPVLVVAAALTVVSAGGASACMFMKPFGGAPMGGFNKMGNWNNTNNTNNWNNVNNWNNLNKWNNVNNVTNQNDVTNTNNVDNLNTVTNTPATNLNTVTNTPATNLNTVTNTNTLDNTNTVTNTNNVDNTNTVTNTNTNRVVNCVNNVCTTLASNGGQPTIVSPRTQLPSIVSAAGNTVPTRPSTVLVNPDPPSTVQSTKRVPVKTTCVDNGTGTATCVTVNGSPSFTG